MRTIRQGEAALYNVCLEKGSDQLFVTQYTLSIYPSLHNVTQCTLSIYPSVHNVTQYTLSIYPSVHNVTQYTLSIYPSVHKQLIQTLFEAQIVFIHLSINSYFYLCLCQHENVSPRFGRRPHKSDESKLWVDILVGINQGVQNYLSIFYISSCLSLYLCLSIYVSIFLSIFQYLSI